MRNAMFLFLELFWPIIKKNMEAATTKNEAVSELNFLMSTEHSVWSEQA